MSFGAHIHYKVQLWKETHSNIKSGWSGEQDSVALTLLLSFSSGVTSLLFFYTTQVGPCILQSSSIETLHEDFQFEHGIEMKTFLHSHSLPLRHKKITLMQTQHFRKIQQNFCAGGFGNLVAFNPPHCTKSTIITLYLTVVILETHTR